jgi:alkanesulfonate monooxygenase SsuD/methylene tetrahydromethanopterin reductase-like flavin-dependent oxidoreductase (luciferase family)
MGHSWLTPSLAPVFHRTHFIIPLIGWPRWITGGMGNNVDARLRAGDPVSLDDFTAQRGIAGTPDDCIAQMERWHRKTGCDYFNGSGGFEAHKRVIELFGKEVLPAISSLGAPPR